MEELKESKYKSLAEVRKEQEEKYGTSNNKFEDFPVGTRVKIITPCEDFNFFYEEEGEVIKNSGEYFGIRVKFDKPRYFEDKYIQHDFNFNPKSLYKLPVKEKVHTIQYQLEKIIDETWCKAPFDVIYLAHVLNETFDIKEKK